MRASGVAGVLEDFQISRVLWAIVTGLSRGGRSTTKDCGELWGRGGARLVRSALIAVVEGVCSW